MNEVVSPGSADEALDMLRSAIRYLAAADATAMTAQEQARCLRVLEQVNSASTAARTSILSAFASAQGHGADAEYSPRAWLIHRTGVTKGAAMAYTAWVRRTNSWTSDVGRQTHRPPERPDLRDQRTVVVSVTNARLTAVHVRAGIAARDRVGGRG